MSSGTLEGLDELAREALPPDAEARRRIVEDLDANILVEAGAGSGKTRQLVARMIALVRREPGVIRHLAAVTFTRKAAAELAQRLRSELEATLAAEPAR